MVRPQTLLSALFIALALLTASSVFAATYPDMASYAFPRPTPTLPSAMDPYSPPVNTSTPVTTTPTFAEWTRSGGPDDNLVVTGNSFSTSTGADLGKDTHFLVYGQNHGGSALIAAKIQRLDAQKGIVTLDATLPSRSMYLLWAYNSHGYGRPVAINRTDAWWLGPDKGAVGESISVYGRNLSYQNGVTTSWIYLQQAGKAGQWVTPSAVNPYRVTFTIPGHLATGSYLVWAHNGHGGRYGWSGPLTITVNTGPGWTNTRFNVKDYGARGDGATDDTAAISRCMKTAAGTPYSTIYFPAGTYCVSNMFTPPSNTRWLGAGMTSTTIICTDFKASAPSLLFSGGGVSNSEFDNLTLNAGSYCGNLWPSSMVHLRGGSDLRFTNVAFAAQGFQPADLSGSNYIFLTDCRVIGRGSFLGGGRQVFITGCHFYGTNDAETLVDEWGREQLRA